MKIVAAPSLYFVHIPKTAGVTVKAFLENHYAADEAFIMDEWKARSSSPDLLAHYRLFSGHYSSEVLKALPARPDVIITLLREPVARFRSWVAHGRRSTYLKYKNTCTQGTDLDVALAWGYITDDRAARIKLRRLLALCWGLTNGPHRNATRTAQQP